MKTVTTAAIIQARMGSTRLPGKVMMDLGGQPMLQHVLRRVRAARGVDEVCLATTTLERDDAVAALASSCGVRVFRGSEEDVLARFAGATRWLGADLVVRITADCPLYDPELLAEMLAARQRLVAESGEVDYYSNCIRGVGTSTRLAATKRPRISPASRCAALRFWRTHFRAHLPPSQGSAKPLKNNKATPKRV